MNTSTYLFIQVGFVLLTLVFFSLLLMEFKKGLTKSSFSEPQKRKIVNRMIIALVAWALFVSGWSLSGRMTNFSKFPFNMAPILIVPLITIIVFTLSKTFREIIIHIPAQNIVRLQVFRIFVEILLWALFVYKLAPVQMTFEGRNFDILSGISAPVIAYLVSRQRLSRTLLILWNLACLGLLINIVAVAILSMPTPLRIFMNEPVNTIVTIFPISWLPAFLVPLAYGLHFMSMRKAIIGNR